MVDKQGRITIRLTQENIEKLSWILSKGEYMYESEIGRRALNIGLNELAAQVNNGKEEG